jgi:hypothetical protein
MSSQGPNTCTSVTQSPTEGGDAWTGLTCMEGTSCWCTNDGNNTECEFLICTGFGFSIPTGATLNGIVVTVTGKDDANADGYFDAATLTLNGTSGSGSGSITNGNLTTSPQTVTCGSSTSLWSVSSLTVSQVNASTFGVIFNVETNGNGNQVYLQDCQMTVYYTGGGGGSVGEAGLLAGTSAVGSVYGQGRSPRRVEGVRYRYR